MWTKDDINQLMRTIIKSYTDIMKDFGDVYLDDDRPSNSKKDDIVVNVISVNDSLPQKATSNVLIYCHDKVVKIGNETQYKKNPKLNKVSQDIFERLLKASTPNGVSMMPTPAIDIADNKINQHCADIRVSWVIAPQISSNNN